MGPKYRKVGEGRKFPADLSADCRAGALLPPVGDDELLVQSYLHNFFVRETTTQPYELYINDVYLKHNFAETKIVQGLGEPEEWYSLLPPEKYQALKERIDLDFAPTNAKNFSADDPVSFDVFVKHVKTLIVKVFEVNTSKCVFWLMLTTIVLSRLSKANSCKPSAFECRVVTAAAETVLTRDQAHLMPWHVDCCMSADEAR